MSEYVESRQEQEAQLGRQKFAEARRALDELERLFEERVHGGKRLLRNALRLA